jgi:hypothetical protein
MKKRTFLVISSIVFVGCQNTVQIREDYGQFSIPDSNKQKAADFISKATQGCQRDCRRAIFTAQYVAEKTFGEQNYKFDVCSSGHCREISIPVSKMNEQQLKLYNEYFGIASE